MDNALLGAGRNRVIRVDPDTVAADEAGLKRQEIPFGPRGRQYVAGIDIKRLKISDTIHEGDVEIALSVLNHFGRFSDPDGRRAMNAATTDP